MWIFLLLHPSRVGIGQFLEANLVVGGLCCLPSFLFRLATFPCSLLVDFGFAFLAFIEACLLPIKKKKRKVNALKKNQTLAFVLKAQFEITSIFFS